MIKFLLTMMKRLCFLTLLLAKLLNMLIKYLVKKTTKCYCSCPDTNQYHVLTPQPPSLFAVQTAISSNTFPAQDAGILFKKTQLFLELCCLYQTFH